ncbi:MAG TPA: DNA-formamidopyrimidine glycosylase family protein [Candidatus Binataceae bacterium]|nr:DNA-formamidopyrimidine glycosylase family protein [Candidatus Binataceae bacterium]
MPELPDVWIYVEALRERIIGHQLTRVTVKSPFLLRSANPPLSAVQGARVLEVRRLGKQIAIGVEDGLWLVLHLKIAGRLHWSSDRPKLGGRNTLAIFEFDHGWLWLTEAGTQRRAALHVAAGEAGLQELNAGGIEPLDSTRDEFAAALRMENHTLKRSLTDPSIFSGIGNAYSDEILHRAQLSPVAMTQKLAPPEIERLYEATRATLIEWTDRLRAEAGDDFPEKVTAFRPEMAVHGRFGEPCPRCGAKIQRIRYASNETNYCARCQTGGKLLADRALSRLMHQDWPRTLDELEARRKTIRSGS